MTEEKKIRIMIVDDHPIFRQGLTELINRQQDLTVCGEAEDAPEAMRSIKRQKPDMVVTDISLKTTNGLELIKDMRVQYRYRSFGSVQGKTVLPANRIR